MGRLEFIEWQSYSREMFHVVKSHYLSTYRRCPCNDKCELVKPELIPTWRGYGWRTCQTKKSHIVSCFMGHPPGERPDICELCRANNAS